MRKVIDIEASNLLNHESIDYLKAPYELKSTFKIWCLVMRDVDNPLLVHSFIGKEEIDKFIDEHLPLITMLVAHNGIDYDFLVLKLLYRERFTYTFPWKTGDKATLNGREVDMVDTLVVSKTLNPDRYGGHSLDEWGKRLGEQKTDWRGEAITLGLIEPGAPKGAEFQQWHPRMGDYCAQDTNVNVKLLWKLWEEMGDWPWQDALTLEHYVRDLITRQSHRGFWFDSELANSNVRDLDEKMEAIRQVVEPLLPPKPLGVTKLKAYMPPKIQFKKNGEVSAVMLKWAEKQGGQLEGTIFINKHGKAWKLPMDCEVPIETHEPATVKDTTHIKGWLVELGWKATQYKERDLTCDAKKNKLTQEKFEAACERYAEQTLNSPFCADRCAELDVHKNSLLKKLLRHDIKRPLKVYTNPTITVGMEKEIDPALFELASQFPHAKLVSEYLTYAHRRNSILGGGVDPDEFDDDDEFQGKGFMAAERVAVDGRIPTPSDTCGAGTSRFKHKLVANVPRITSLYGDKMRAQFGVDVDDGFIQLGYDFDSLEAKVEAHYVYKYPGGPEYGVSLTAEKPNDCHSVLAAKISTLIGRTFPRGPAKNVKYGCVPTDNTEVLTPRGWRRFDEVRVGTHVVGYNMTNGKLEPTPIIDTWFYKDADVVRMGHSSWNFECTEDHRWVGVTGYNAIQQMFIETSEVQTNTRLVTSGLWGTTAGAVAPHEAALVGWLLSDGYYKWSEKPDGTSSRRGEKRGIVASIAQADHKYVAELLTCLRQNGFTWKESDLGSLNENTNTSFRLKAADVRPFLDRVVGSRDQKHDVDWSQWVLKLSVQAREAFLHAFWLADGTTTKKHAKVVKQNRGKIMDAVALGYFLSGYKVTTSGGKCATINATPDRLVGMQTGKIEPSRTADVFCLTTGLGTFVIRQNGRLSVTGNCSYNAQPARVAKTVGCTVEEGRIIFDAFWEQASPLKELKEKMQDYWGTVGEKKFLRGIDGRKLPIRSKGNVINTAFQSAGVICAKRAMMMHEVMLKEEGMFVDFFLDDWKAKKEFCQQLIAYHDEAQCEVKRTMVTWKKFINKEECEAFTDSDKLWSEPVHNDKGWFRGYCRAGELASQAVVEAGRYYKLNVELSAGYILGRNWAECH